MDSSNTASTNLFEEVECLRSQAQIARNELNKLRKELQTLKTVHKKEVEKIKSLMSQQMLSCGSGKETHDSEINSDRKKVQTETPSSAAVSRTDLQKYLLNPVGTIKSVFKTKNGIPRQSSVCDVSRATLTVDKTVFNNPEHSLEGLRDFSHIWIIFIFHKNNNCCVKAKVRPPRLNGVKVGVFSSRCPYRPNPVGLSLVKLDKVTGSTLHLSGVDLLDGTPVLDIKPYIPEYDYVGPVLHKPYTDAKVPDLVSTDISTPDTPEVAGNKPITTVTAYKDRKATDKTKSDTVNIENMEYECPSKPVEDGVNTRYCDNGTEQSTCKSVEVIGKCDEGARQHSVSLESGMSQVTSENVEIASWVTNPPIAKLDVRFTPTALQQLELCAKSNSHGGEDEHPAGHKLEYTYNIEEVTLSIVQILQNDPRSIYRRKKCTDRLYYFSVDTVHITCWFDNFQQMAEVLKIEPTKTQSTNLKLH